MTDETPYNPFSTRAKVDSSAPSPDELAGYELSDLGNAKRFIRMAGGTFDEWGDVDLSACTVLYLRQRGWTVFYKGAFNLMRGEELAHRHALRVAAALVEQMHIRAAKAEADGYSAKFVQSIRDFATSSGNSGKLNGMLNVAANQLMVDMEDFDRDPFALNCRNGVVRFRRGDGGKPVALFQPGHDPRDRFTRMAACDYDPRAAAPLFRGVVDYALPDPDDRAYVHKAMGYAATGSTEEQKFFVFQGKGGDGKSTIVNAVRQTLGTYATVAGIETCLDTGVKRGSEASPDSAALAGDTRMISAGEPPSGSKLATGAIKQFTGGGTMKARELRQGLFEFDPLGKPFIECNRRPTINDTDDGIWRRLKIVPFRVQVPKDQIDPTLPRRIKAEADGIMAWLVEGVLGWMLDGLKDTASVKDALEDYRKGSNPFAQWMEDRVELDPNSRIEATVLFKDYTAWMEAQGHDRPMSQKAFGGALGDLQILLAGKNAAGRMTRRGAKLKDGSPSRAAENLPGAGGSEADDPFSDPDWGPEQ